MPQYGEVRVDFITYTTGVAPNEGNVTVPISGLINAPTFSGDVVIEGDLTVSGDIIASGVTISGITGLFASGTEAAPSISFVDNTDTGFYNAAANEIRITTSGNDRLTIDDTGKVGVGTTFARGLITSQASSGVTFTYNDNEGDAVFISNENISVGSGTFGAGITWGRPNVQGTQRVASIASVQTADDNDQCGLVFITKANAGNTLDLQESLRITHNGRVGIGTTNPGTKLDVYDGIIQVQSATESTATNASLLNAVTGPTGSSLFTIRAENTADDNSNWEIKTNADEELKFTVGSSEVMRLNSNARVLVFTTTARGNFRFNNSDTNPRVQVEGTGAGSAISIIRNNDGSNGPVLFLGKSREATVGSNAIVQDGDRLGSVSFNGADGVNLIQAARIDGNVDGTPGQTAGTFVIGTEYRILTTGTTDFTLIGAADSNPGTVFTATGVGTGTGTAIRVAGDMPGRLTFLTTNDGTNSPAERMRITSDGYVGIASTNPVATLQIGGTAEAGVPTLYLSRAPNTATTSDIALTANAIIRGNNSIRHIVNDGGLFSWWIGGTDVTAGVTGATEVMRIDTDGRLLVGTTSARTAGGATRTPHLQVEGTTGSDSSISITRNADDTNQPFLVLGKTRGSNVGDSTIVQDGDGLGEIRFAGADGVDLASTAASIGAEVDGNTGTDDMPGRLVFSTTANNASSPTERMRISNNGNIGFNFNEANGVDNITIGDIVSTSGTQRFISVRGKSTNVANSVSAFSSITWGGADNDTAYTTSNVRGLDLNGYTPGTNQTVTNAYGVRVTNEWTFATNNYGFYSDIDSSQGTNRWNFYANGDADNYFSGNVGIGTANPDAKLGVQDFSDFTLNTNTIDYTAFLEGGLTQGNGNYGASLGFSRINSVARTGAVIAAKQTTNDADQIGIAFLTHASASTNTNLVEQMLITHDGNVGIGTNSPTVKLHVNSSDTTRVFLEDDTGKNEIRTNNGNLSFFTNQEAAVGGNNNTIFYRNGSNESMRIDSEGRLLVGTTSSRAVGSSESVLQLEGNTNDSKASMSIVHNRADADGPEFKFGKSRGTTSGSTDLVSQNDILGQINFFGADGTDLESLGGRIECRVDGTPGANDMPGRLVFYTTANGASTPTERMRILTGGSVRISSLAGTGNRAVYSNGNGNLTNDSSDATLKTNVTTLGNQSEVVKQLRPVTYNWIDTEERGEQQEVGFIAQEVQPLVPQVIGVNNDETLSVDYSKLTAVLTKALQEAIERIEQLESRLAALENS